MKVFVIFVMALFTLADTHLSFGCDKPMNIFRGWDDYVSRLENNWRSLVSPEDVVVIPGDISWAMTTEEATEDFRFLNSLPGAKIIGKGNHDYWWQTMNKLNKFIAENNFDTIKFLFNNAYRFGDISVCGSRGWFFDAEGADSEQNKKVIDREAGRLRRSIEEGISLGGTPVVFMHYPVSFDGKTCEPLMDVLKEYNIKRCYFGHIHGDRSGRFADYEVDGIRFSLISADALEFLPKKVMV